MRVLVTGCAGFIGSRTCNLLLDKGSIKVVGIDNLRDASYNHRVKEQRLQKLLRRDNFTFVRTDITDRNALSDLFENNRFNAVINLAAVSGVRACLDDPWSFVDINITGTLNLLELCVKHNIKKFIVASSSSVYGEKEQKAASEKMSTDKPLTQYGATKKSVEVLCYSYHYLYGMDITALRYFTCYGPNGRPDMSLHIFIENILNDRPIEVFGDGTQKRDFTYVDDIAEGTVRSLGLQGYNIINLGNNNPVELLYTIKLIEENLGKKAQIIFKERNKADTLLNYTDTSKAKRLLGWEPKVKIEEGIRRMVRWHLENKTA